MAGRRSPSSPPRVVMLPSGVAVWRPTATELAAAEHKRLPDLIAPGLSVLFCGINPGLYSAATGHHFARPGNRFWPALFESGLTPRLLHPFEGRKILDHRLGITNLVARTTASADLLTRHEMTTGAKELARKVRRYVPKVLAMVGLGAYRIAFADPKAVCGLQRTQLGSTRVWLLPNPSGLNAHHRPSDLAALFRELQRFVATLEPTASAPKAAWRT